MIQGLVVAILVYANMYISIFTHIYIYVSIHLFIYLFMCMWMDVRIRLCLHICIQVLKRQGRGRQGPPQTLLGVSRHVEPKPVVSSIYTGRPIIFTQCFRIRAYRKDGSLAG